MIKAKEIQQKALKGGVRDTQIEKDYILSWILYGIAQHEALSKFLVFKGGTVLKKIYFDDYRFSEDLDFTLLDPAITNDQIFVWFNETFAYARETTNIPFSLQDNHEHQDGGINFLSKMFIRLFNPQRYNLSSTLFMIPGIIFSLAPLTKHIKMVMIEKRGLSILPNTSFALMAR